MTQIISKTNWLFFSTPISTEKSCIERYWKANIVRILKLRWSVRKKLRYRTVMIVKYVWLTWRPTKNGAPRIHEFMEDSSHTSTKLSWSAASIYNAIIAIWHTILLSLWGRTMRNPLLNGIITSKNFMSRLYATTTPSSGSIQTPKSKLWSFHTST